VSSKDGWLPSGSSCSLQNSEKKAFCVMGKCLEFAEDKTPKYDISKETMNDIKRIMVRPRSLRHKRELIVESPQRVGIDQSYLQQIIQEVNATHFNTNHQPRNNINQQQQQQVMEIAFHNPIDIFDEDMIPHADFEAFHLTSCSSSYQIPYYVLFLLSVIVVW
jgi:hypothetical protein